MANKLLNEDQAQLLDLINNLSSCGIHEDIPLPQLIVTGNQSVGKSSLLQAISGIKFPVNSSQCTRFPTRICLRRGPEEPYKVSITPGPTASSEVGATLTAFKPQISDISELGIIIQKAWFLMDDTTTSPLKDHELVVESTHPQNVNLTLVDLPGLIATTKDNESPEQIQSIEKLVRKHMANKHSIIMAVVSAESDLLTQSVLRMVQDEDKTGSRTLAVITKPDRSGGPDRQNVTMRWARNEEKRFKLGWHTVKLADSDVNQDETPAQSQEEEEIAFFAKSPWNKLSRSEVGIPALRTRLSTLLRIHVADHLPQLMEEVKLKLTECNDLLERMGSVRSTAKDQRQFLVNVAERLTHLIRDALVSHDEDEILREENMNIRSQIEEIKLMLSTNMRLYGLRDKLKCEHMDSKSLFAGSDSNCESDLPDILSSFAREYRAQKTLTCYEHASDVEVRVVKTNRSTPYDINPNPKLVAKVARDLAMNWKILVDLHLLRIHKRLGDFLRNLLPHLVDGHTTNRLWTKKISPKLSVLESEFRSKISELLIPYRVMYANTGNREYTKALLDWANCMPNTTGAGDHVNEADTRSSYMLVHGAYSLYETALPNMIENMATLAVENCLLKGFREIFTPSAASAIDDEAELELLGGEAEDAIQQREECQTKRIKLRNALDMCEDFLIHSQSQARYRSSVRHTVPETIRVEKTIPEETTPPPPLTPDRSSSPTTPKPVTPASTSHHLHLSTKHRTYLSPSKPGRRQAFVSDAADGESEL